MTAAAAVAARTRTSMQLGDSSDNVSGEWREATESAAVTDAAAPDDCHEVCLLTPRERYALQVPCGHAQFCER